MKVLGHMRLHSILILNFLCGVGKMQSVAVCLNWNTHIAFVSSNWCHYNSERNEQVSIVFLLIGEQIVASDNQAKVDSGRY